MSKIPSHPKATHSVVNKARNIQTYFNNTYEKAEEVQGLAKVKQYLKDIQLIL
jgi:hypothetical protein